MARGLWLLMLLFSLAACNRDKQTMSGEFSARVVNPDFARDIAPFIFKNCSHCHSQQGMAPLYLTNYRQISKFSDLVSFMLENHLMPPWKPDPTYSSFVREVQISDREIAMFNNWINAGMPRGDTTHEVTYAGPVYDSVDLHAPNTILVNTGVNFVHPGDGADHYEHYTLPFTMDSDLYINRVEIIGENRRIMHHALVGAIPKDIDPETITPEMLMHISPVAGFLPGATSTYLPDGYARHIERNSKWVVELHYSHSNTHEIDTPKLLLHTFSPKQAKDVRWYFMVEDSLVNPPLELQPDEVKSFYLRHTLEYDMEVLSVTPHMHNRGKKYTAFAVRAQTGDTVPLIRINDWDFNWQNMYYFKKPVHLKAGDRVMVDASYDNTSLNPRNPVVPTVKVINSEKTTDEMLQFLMEVVYEGEAAKISATPLEVKSDKKNTSKQR